MITYKLIDKYTIHVDVPWKMKDSFRHNFPDATWNPEVKKWRLFKSDALLERLNTYQEKSASASTKARELEQIEYTYHEEVDLQRQCDKLDAEFDSLLASGKRLDALIAGLEATKAKHDLKYQRNLAERTEAREKVRQVQMVIDKIIEPLEVKEDISALVSAWKALSGGLRYSSTSELRAEILEAQESLKDSYEMIRDNRGVVLNTLRILSEIPFGDKAGPEPQVVARELYRDVSFRLETSH